MNRLHTACGWLLAGILVWMPPGIGAPPDVEAATGRVSTLPGLDDGANANMTYGRVTAVDPDAALLMLGGETLPLSPRVGVRWKNGTRLSLEDVVPGSRVQVQFQQVGNRRIVNQIILIPE